MSDIVLRFPMNTQGRDWVCGDIHGEFDKLTEQMDRVSFDPAVDRLFSVGDLVDRGPQSADAVNWIAQPWFHAVRGNHEDMAIRHACGRSPEYYEANGGRWMMDLPPAQQAAIAQVFLTLPIAIEVETEAGLIGIVHAEPHGICWQDFTRRLREGDAHAEAMAMWSRSRISSRNRIDVRNIAAVYVGHSPLERPTWLGNVRYIDTGAVFGGRLTLAQISGPGAELTAEELESAGAD